MTIRRMIVWISSVISGAISVSITILIFSSLNTHLPLASSILIFLSFSSLAFIWLDYFLKTKYLRAEDWV
jgi:uncharacterized membrane protein